MGAARRIRRTVREALDKAGADAAAESGAPRQESVRVSHPTNVVIAGNMGADGSAYGVSKRQRVRVRQHGGDGYEETETTETRLSSGDRSVTDR